MDRRIALVLLVAVLTVSCLPSSPLVITRDGKRLIYHTPSDLLVDRVGPSKLLSYDLSTGEEGVLYESEGAIRAPALSPDEKKVAFFVVTKPPPRGQFQDPRRVTLTVLDLETAEADALASFDVDPLVGVNVLSWSPDGKTLVYGDTAHDMPEIRLIDLATGRRTLLTEGEMQGISPAFSPDGTEIACLLSCPIYYEHRSRKIRLEVDGGLVPYGDKYSMLSLIDVATGDVELLTLSVTGGNFLSGYCRPVWSHSGTKIACFLTPDLEGGWGATDLYVFDLETGAPKLISRGAGTTIGGVSWSPDDSRIAFHRLLDNDSYLARIEVADVQNGRLTRVVDDNRPNFLPQWSPVDNDLLFFCTFLGGRLNADSFLRSLNVSTGQVSLILLTIREEEKFAQLSGTYKMRQAADAVARRKETRALRDRLEHLSAREAVEELASDKDIYVPDILEHALPRLQSIAASGADQQLRMEANLLIVRLCAGRLPDVQLEAWEAIAKERELAAEEKQRLRELYYIKARMSLAKGDFDSVVYYGGKRLGLRSYGSERDLSRDIDCTLYIAAGYLGLGRPDDAQQLLQELAASGELGKAMARDLLEQLREGE